MNLISTMWYTVHVMEPFSVALLGSRDIATFALILGPGSERAQLRSQRKKGLAMPPKAVFDHF